VRVLLVEPQRSRKYYTSYPPLGLLKLARYHKSRGDRVALIHGLDGDGYDPDRIYVTSLFTYAWEAVHITIQHYLKKYPKAKLTVGGIYASLCPGKLRRAFGSRIAICRGVRPELDCLRPDYSLVPKWDASIVFSSRGCIRKCAFCSVRVLEPEFSALRTVRRLIDPKHRRIVLWDNNVLASPHWRAVFAQLAEIGKPVDFNQGLDARLMTEGVVEQLGKLNVPVVRLAFDTVSVRGQLKRAIDLLLERGYNGRRIIVYCLHNYNDTPEDLFTRTRDLLDWGVAAYPMRYEPLEPREKNSYVAPGWSARQLDMVAHARRVIGYGGAFPPYEGLRKKFANARGFSEAFGLRPRAH